MVDSLGSKFGIDLEECVEIDLRDTDEAFVAEVDHWVSSGLTKQEAVTCAINGLFSATRQKVA